ncbi:MAG: hypothetical protein ACYSUD_21450 [Planctomycetota bacterium]
MAIDAKKVSACLEECKEHLTNELLPFWLDRCRDDENGGFITHFDKDGNDSGEDEKSMLAQARTPGPHRLFDGVRPSCRPRRGSMRRVRPPRR